MAAATSERYYENFLNSYADYQSERDFFIYDSPHTRSIAPGTKEGVRELNRWYHEGLISTDFAFDTNETQFKLDITTGKTFSFTVDFLTPFNDNLIQPLRDAVPEAELILIDPFVNVHGVSFKNAYDINGQMMMVPKHNEARAEAAVRFLDWMVKPENILRITYGVEGEHYHMEDGVPLPLLSVGEMKAQGFFNQNDICLIGAFNLETPERYMLADAKRYPEYSDMILATKSIRYSDGNYHLPVFDPPLDTDAKYANKLRSMLRDMVNICIITPPSEFDRVYQLEYEKFLEVGGSAVLEAREKAYDAGAVIR